MPNRRVFPNSKTYAAKRGAALLLILGLTFVMSVVLSAFLYLVEQQIKLKGLYQDNDELRTQAYCALESTVAVLGMFAQVDKKLYSPVQGWENPLYFASLDPLDVTLEDGCGIDSLDYPEEIEEDFETRQARLEAMTPEERERAQVLEMRNPRDIFNLPPLPFPNGIKVEVQITDETGRISLRARNSELLFELFKKLDLTDSQATELLDCLLDWIDSDDDMRTYGAEQNYYDTLDPSVIVPNRALQTLDELRYIKEFRDLFYTTDGQPNDRWRALSELVTLHDHSKININTAPLGVLELFEERDDLKVSTVVDYRSGSDRILNTPDDVLIKELGDVGVITGNAQASEDGQVSGTGSIAHLLGTTCQLLRIRIVASRGDSKFILSVLASVNATGGDSGGKSAGASGAASSKSSTPITIEELQENREIE